MNYKHLTWFACTILVLAAASVRAGTDSENANEQLLKKNKIATDGPALLEFFRHRTLTPEERRQVETWMEQLGSNLFRRRERATKALIQRGPVVLGLLEKLLTHPDEEVRLRAKKSAKAIRDRDYVGEVIPAAARLLREKKPDGTVKVLLAYFPFAGVSDAANEVLRTIQALAIQNGRANKTLVASLEARDPVIRAAAAFALAHTQDHKLKATIVALLKDRIPLVRMRAACGLIEAGERQAVPVLINTLPDLSYMYAFAAEDLLLRVANNKDLPKASVRKGRKALQECRDAWSTWWAKNGKTIDLTKIPDRPQLLGYTVVVLLDENRILELDRSNQIRWQLDKINFPLDVQILPNGNLMVAEYHASLVSERTIKGEIKWQHRIVSPLAVQRLPNGNTFIGTDSMVLEVDAKGNRVFTYSFPNSQRIRKSAKLPDGNFVCLRDDNYVVVVNPSNRRIVRSFQVDLQRPLFGGKLHMLPNGNVLIPHNAEKKVVEYDKNGKIVWQVPIDEPIAARRLPNGNTLVTSMSEKRAVEFDRERNEVWEYRATTRVTRALRR